jgi:uncharacterized delta-60 repeat protein
MRFNPVANDLLKDQTFKLAKGFFNGSDIIPASPAYPYQNNVNKVVILNDGSIYVASGAFYNYPEQPASPEFSNGVIKLTIDGNVDKSFYVRDYTGGTGYDLAIQSDGKVLLGSNSNGLNRFNTNGTLDTTFYQNGTSGSTASDVNSLLLESNGKILICGVFDKYSGITVNGLLRLNTDGSIDNTFTAYSGLTFNLNYPSKILKQSTGKYIVINKTTGQICRLNTDGSLDNTFNSGNTGFSQNVVTMFVDTDDTILIGTSGSTAYNTYSVNNGIVKINADGTYNNYWNYTNPISAITKLIDGKFLIGFTNNQAYSATTVPLIKRINTDFTIDNTFISPDLYAWNYIVSSYTQTSISTIAVQPQNNAIAPLYNIITGGNFANQGSLKSCSSGIIKLNKDGICLNKVYTIPPNIKWTQVINYSGATVGDVITIQFCLKTSNFNGLSGNPFPYTTSFTATGTTGSYTIDFSYFREYLKSVSRGVTGTQYFKYRVSTSPSRTISGTYDYSINGSSISSGPYINYSFNCSITGNTLYTANYSIYGQNGEIQVTTINLTLT